MPNIRFFLKNLFNKKKITNMYSEIVNLMSCITYINSNKITFFVTSTDSSLGRVRGRINF